ncbi:MAG TPA: tRNA-uridine aminocarboxypropyltransferase [Polyangiales bacterium]|nr:tRNA-uridine aminocarboxypropyltransferase [Polyangiales bacterium]
MFRAECERCGRPRTVCYCEAITPVPTRTRVLLLQHPREHGKAVNTARIAALALPNSELHVGVEPEDFAGLNAALSDPDRPAVILYPSSQARDLATDPPLHPVTLVVIDGTWHQARKLLRKNPDLLKLPHYAFEPKAPSEYQIRREPRPEYVSTIEALACALPFLEGDHARFEALLAPFRRMVAMQVAFASRSPGGRKRERRRNSSSARARLPAELTSPSLVCVGGEANAWPYDRELGEPRHPHELVHWLGVRVATGERFEALAHPRKPLADSPMIHARLREPALRAADGIDTLISRYDAFSQPDDVLCVWGYYALDLLARERGAKFARVLDVRKVVGDFLKQKAGSLEGLVADRKLAFEPLGEGRGGERLGMLTAVTRWLVQEAHAG